MFTSGKGLTADGLYKTDMLTAMAEQKMLNVVGKLVVLVDSSKVGERAGMLFSRAKSNPICSLPAKMQTLRFCNSLKLRAWLSLCAFKGAGGKSHCCSQRFWRDAMSYATLPTGRSDCCPNLPESALAVSGRFQLPVQHHHPVHATATTACRRGVATDA